MEQEGLTSRQWGALLWAAALSPGAELFPAVGLEQAGRGVWLTPVVSLLILFPLLWFSRQWDGAALRTCAVGRVTALLCGVWMEVLLVLRLTLCARRMLWSGERDGAVWFFLLTLTALALWMGSGKLSALGRAGQIYLIVLLGAAILVLGLSLPKVRADRILPLWFGDAGPILLTALSGAGSLCWAVLPMLFLPAHSKSGKSLALWGGGGCLLLSVAQLIVVGNLGVGLCARSESAFFALTKSVGIEGAFQRVESVVAALWMLSDLTLTVILTRAIGLCAESLHRKLNREGVGSFALLAAAGVALWGTRWGASVTEWNRDWVWIGSLVACIVAIVGMFIVKKTKTP